MTPTASAIEVIITKPSGIMPTTEATVLVITELTFSAMSLEVMLNMAAKPTPLSAQLVRYMRMPMGKMAMVTILIIQFIERMSCDLDFLYFFASERMVAAKLSLPTLTTRARQLPACTTLPESSSAPCVLCISSCSPVSMLSLTSHSPLTTTLSEAICSPACISMMSSMTISDMSTCFFSPPRITLTLGTLSSDIFSSTNLERIS